MKKTTISFVIPVYNEEKRIDRTIKALLEGFDYDGLKLEKVIFVDDGSVDNTVGLINKSKSKIEKKLSAKLEVVSYSPNKGKGYAIRNGMKASDSDYTLFFDADMATPINQIERLMPYIKEGRDVIIGTRKNGESTVQVHQPKHREILGKGFTYLSNLTLNTWVTDFTCGFKIFSRKAKNDIFKRAKIDRWGYDAELMFLAQRLGYKVTEKSVLWYDDHNTKVKLTKSIFTTLKELTEIRYNQIRGHYEFSYASS